MRSCTYRIFDHLWMEPCTRSMLRLGSQKLKEMQHNLRSSSGQTLTEPVVADALGRLFSKEAVIEYVLAR